MKAEDGISRRIRKDSGRLTEAMIASDILCGAFEDNTVAAVAEIVNRDNYSKVGG